jgi:hypothetical protein
MCKAVRTRKAILLPYAPFVMMRYTEKNKIKRQGRTGRYQMQKIGAFINDFSLTIFSVTPSFVEAFCTGDRHYGKDKYT